MKYNILFLIIVFIIITIIFLIIPSRNFIVNNPKSNDKLIKVENTKEYSALVLKNNNKSLKIKPEKFKIFNVSVTNDKGEQKNVYLFEEPIIINFDYELPKGKYVFKIELPEGVELFHKQDILRMGKGRTNENPLLIKILPSNSLKEVYLKNINILVYQTDNYENPLFTYTEPINIVIENIKEKIVTNLDNESLIENKTPSQSQSQNQSQNQNLDDEANTICEDIVKNYSYPELKIHLPILEYCAKRGIKKAQTYIEKYYETLEFN